MSLYLAVFDKDDHELSGFQVGTYHDYGRFIEIITEHIKKEECPLLINHHDSDGFWSTTECKDLLSELTLIREKLIHLPAQEINYDWAKDINYQIGGNLHSSLQNVDGQPIIDALISLCELSIKNNAQVYFQ
jgi:hypothetical protein